MIKSKFKDLLITKLFQDFEFLHVDYINQSVNEEKKRKVILLRQQVQETW